MALRRYDATPCIRSSTFSALPQARGNRFCAPYRGRAAAHPEDCRLFKALVAGCAGGNGSRKRSVVPVDQSRAGRNQITITATAQSATKIVVADGIPTHSVTTAIVKASTEVEAVLASIQIDITRPRYSSSSRA